MQQKNLALLRKIQITTESSFFGLRVIITVNLQIPVSVLVSQPTLVSKVNAENFDSQY